MNPNSSNIPFNNGIAHYRVGFKCITRTISRKYSIIVHEFLPDDVTLEGEREVALMELTVPGRWLNVTEGKFVLLDLYHENFRNPEWQTTLTLPPEQYESIYSIKTVMNDLAAKRSYGAKITSIELTTDGRLRIDKEPEHCAFSMLRIFLKSLEVKRGTLS